MATVRSGLIRAAAGVACAAVALSGCAKAVPGSARANKAAADKATAAAYEAGIKAFRSHFDSVRDEKGKLYNYLRFGSKNREREFETAMLGTPPALLFKQHDSEPGDEYDQFHPAGSEVDYIRLGDKHKNLAPTRWVSVPTDFPKGSPVQVCLTIVGFAACHLEKAIAQTKLEAPDRQPHQAHVTDGGTEINSGITLGTAIEENLIVPPEDIAKEITTEMKQTMLPVRIDLNGDGDFTKFEIRTTVSGGPATLEVQLGYEVTGKSGDKDFPEVPAPGEVTALTDKATIDKLWDDIINDR